MSSITTFEMFLHFLLCHSIMIIFPLIFIRVILECVPFEGTSNFSCRRISLDSKNLGVLLLCCSILNHMTTIVITVIVIVVIIIIIIVITVKSFGKIVTTSEAKYIRSSIRSESKMYSSTKGTTAKKRIASISTPASTSTTVMERIIPITSSRPIPVPGMTTLLPGSFPFCLLFFSFSVIRRLFLLSLFSLLFSSYFFLAFIFGTSFLL
mmetsp:Transcript_44519/g.53870  ORF Transcript_44519/g.53870 Transcript_44519/m.53870 type:complete len:209 (+) Transcript_44519:233-859(+)